MLSMLLHHFRLSVEDATSPLLILLVIQMAQSHLLSSLGRLIAVRLLRPICTSSHKEGHTATLTGNP